MKLKSFTCPCCGYVGLKARPYARLPTHSIVRGLTPPYANHFGLASYEVCHCCGFEFGNDDDPGTAGGESFEQYLAEWVRDGCNWFQQDERPDDWNLESQLRASRTIDSSTAATNEVTEGER